MIDVRRARELLGRHVLRRAHRLLRARDRLARLRLPHDLRQTEVRDLDAALLVHEHVLGLDVAVHDALGVRELERVADLAHDRQRARHVELFAAQELAQVDALDVLHQQPAAALRAAGVVDADDVGVREARERVGLALEARGEAGFVAGARDEDLERDPAAEGALARLVDGTHAALAEQLGDLELGKERRDLGDLGRQRRRSFRAPVAVERGIRLRQALREQAARTERALRGGRRERRGAARAVRGAGGKLAHAGH